MMADQRRLGRWATGEKASRGALFAAITKQGEPSSGQNLPVRIIL